MPKSLKDIIGPRAGRNVSKGEEKFLDQHKVAEKDYPVKQKTPDATHKATSVSHVSGEKYGHIAPGESEAKYKEANEEAKSCNMTNEGTLCEVHGMKTCPEKNVNELSTATLKSYKEKQLFSKDKSPKQSFNRLVGSARASRKIDAKKNNEDVDYEGEMAKTQLKALSAKASALASMMSDNQQLEAWVQSKLTNAKHDIDAVHDYLTYGEPTKEDAPNDALMTFPGMNVDTALGRV